MVEGHKAHGSMKSALVEGLHRHYTFCSSGRAKRQFPQPVRIGVRAIVAFAGIKLPRGMWHDIALHACLASHLTTYVVSSTSCSVQVKKPSRDLPLGILGALGIVTVCYMLMSAALVMMTPLSALDLGAPFAAAFA